MFTLDRVSLTTIGLGIGLVLSGCASPTGETAEADEAAVDETTAALQEEQAMVGNTDQQQDEGQPQDATQPADGEENTDSSKSAIFIGGGFGRGFGWGGGLGWGRGIGWGGGLGWGRGLGWGWGRGLGWGVGGWGVPVGGWGVGGWGVPVGIGYGYNTGFVGGCGLYGCGRAFW